MSAHVSDLRWDRYLAGELPADDVEVVLAHAKTCEACGARLREITAGRDAFADRPFPIALRRRRTVKIGAAMMAVAAAAALVLVLRPRGELYEGRKGTGPELVLEAGAPLSTGDVVRPGAMLQAGYTSDRDGFGAVLARDGAGGVFAYVPSRGDLMVALPAGEQRAFPEATQLDDVLGRERVIVLWCSLPHALSPLLAQLRATGEIAAPPGCHPRIIDLEKRP